jgi:hypothetical protein
VLFVLFVLLILASIVLSVLRYTDLIIALVSSDFYQYLQETYIFSNSVICIMSIQNIKLKNVHISVLDIFLLHFQIRSNKMLSIHMFDQSFALCVVFCRVLFVLFVLLILASILLSVLRYTHLIIALVSSDFYQYLQET